MRPLTVLALLLPAPALAGEPSGLDPAVLDACIAGAAAHPEDCAGKAAAACVAFWAGRDPGRDGVTVRLNCLDAEQQLWEVRLTEAYDAALAKASRPEVAPAIRAAERAWIAFRDARCAAEAQLYGHGTGGAIAAPECRLHETARQTALLTRWAAED